MPRRRRRFHRVRRYGRRFAHRVRHTQRMGSKIINGIALFIGLSDVIFRFQEQGWVNDPQASLRNLAHDYSLGLSDGSFDQQAAIRAYGPLVGAYGFKKGMSFLMRHIKLKL